VGAREATLWNGYNDLFRDPCGGIYLTKPWAAVWRIPEVIIVILSHIMGSKVQAG